MVYPQPDTPDLSRIRSEAIAGILARALASCNEVASLADWSKALVAHMRLPLTPDLKAEIETRWPALTYFSEDGTPHTAAHEGYIDGTFAVSFPRA
ncbi:MAG: hypothetical protein ACK4NO_08810 [Glycocaulis sp.]